MKQRQDLRIIRKVGDKMLLKCAGTGSSGNAYALIADDGEIMLIGGEKIFD